MNPLAREYMYARGMTDPWIDYFKIGYNRGWRRYCFPLIYKGECWGIQYRIDPRVEFVVKYLRMFEHFEHKVELQRYLSEPGSHNHALYAAEEINRKLPYVILIEGVADVVGMWSAGVPAASTFQGNNKAKPWDTRWNRFFNEVNTVYVIPDNDNSGSGEFFAEQKAQAIGNKAYIHRLPNGYKDVGEFIQENPAATTERLAKWLVLPPMIGLLEMVAGPTEVAAEKVALLHPPTLP
jgi:hypothetical protein